MEHFYSQWLIQEQHLLNDLISVPQDSPDLHIPLINCAVSHYAEYYKHKSQLADHDIFRAFSAYWLTYIERSFFWLGGLKPGIFFHSLPLDLTLDQSYRVEQLRQQTMGRIHELEEKMRVVEEAMSVLMALAAVHGKVRNGEARGYTTERVGEMMRAVLDEADELRKNVVRKNIEILSTAQTAIFCHVSASPSLLLLARFAIQRLLVTNCCESWVNSMHVLFCWWKVVKFSLIK